MCIVKEITFDDDKTNYKCTDCGTIFTNDEWVENNKYKINENIAKNNAIIVSMLCVLIN